MTSTYPPDITDFLNGSTFAVAGASTNRAKYGNKVLRAYIQNDKTVYPINPRADSIENVKAYPSLADLPETVHGLSIITPPAITEHIIQQATELGIKHIWCQPGAEHDDAIDKARDQGVNVIAHGPCLLVILQYTESNN